MARHERMRITKRSSSADAARGLVNLNGQLVKTARDLRPTRFASTWRWRALRRRRSSFGPWPVTRRRRPSDRAA